MPARQTPRDRLIETAASLFYERGLPHIGINEVTDRAGVARMSLYNNFASKEALAVATFERLSEQRRTLIEDHVRKARSPSGRLTAAFDAAERLASASRFKGCAFINLAAQEVDPVGPLHALARAHKDWIRALFQSIAAAAGHTRPQTTAQQLLALWDGAIVEAYIQQSLAPIHAARRAAVALLGAKS